MTKILDNLSKQLKNMKMIADLKEHYEYIKITTLLELNHSNECFMLYAQETEDGILITDLNEILEGTSFYEIPDEIVEKLASKHKLIFDGKYVFALTSLENINQTIENFFNLVKELNI